MLCIRTPQDADANMERAHQLGGIAAVVKRALERAETAAVGESWSDGDWKFCVEVDVICDVLSHRNLLITAPDEYFAQLLKTCFTIFGGPNPTSVRMLLKQRR
jgi:hypothetical protein